MFFSSKQKKIENLLDEYRKQIAIAMDGMLEALKVYADTGNRELLRENFKPVRKSEGRADDIRREIEVFLYSKALFPESRGDILRLLEAMDKVPNQAESVVATLLSHHIVIDAQFKDKFIELANTGCQCVAVLLEAVEKLFSDYTTATVLVGKVDQIESKADRLELELMDAIFASSIDKYDKLLLRNLNLILSSVCDRAENAADRIRIYVAKRGL